MGLISEDCRDPVTPDGKALTYEGKIALERLECGGKAIFGGVTK
jgi:hypothetical protein